MGLSSRLRSTIYLDIKSKSIREDVKWWVCCFATDPCATRLDINYVCIQPSFLMPSNMECAVFNGLYTMKNVALLNSMHSGYMTFVEGIADSRTDPYVILDEIRTAWKPSPDSTVPEAADVFDMISGGDDTARISEAASAHSSEPDYATKDIGYGITWKDVAEWANRGECLTESVAKKLAPLALAFATGVGLGPSIHNAVADKYNNAKVEWNSAKDFNRALKSASQWNASAGLLGKWRYIDYKDKPGIYTDSLCHTSLSDLEGERSMVNPNERIKVGWIVSPDGDTLMSTVTGRVYRPSKSFDDPTFTREDLGPSQGVGVLYIDKGLVDDAYPWDIEAVYGK